MTRCYRDSIHEFNIANFHSIGWLLYEITRSNGTGYERNKFTYRLVVQLRNNLKLSISLARQYGFHIRQLDMFSCL